MTTNLTTNSYNRGNKFPDNAHFLDSCQGYRYLQSSLLLAKDLKVRLRYARKVKRNHLGQDFWNTAVSMYVDGKGFQFKTNPQDMVRAPREWRLRGEGLRYTLWWVYHTVLVLFCASSMKDL